MNEKKWFALYTRARWEKKVSEFLTRKKIENYCPTNRVVRQWSDRKKIVHEPLFTSYVFVRAADFDITFLKQVQGVINFVYWLGKPAVVRDSEIVAIRNFLAGHVNIRLEKTPIYAHDKVQVLSGPLKELEGEVLSVKSRTVRVALPSLGYLMLAEIETENIKVISHVIPAAINMSYPLYAIR